MPVIRIPGLSGSSRESWPDAVDRAVVEATKLLQPMTALRSGRQRASNVSKRLDEYTATVCVAFIVESPDVPDHPVPIFDVQVYDEHEHVNLTLIERL